MTLTPTCKTVSLWHIPTASQRSRSDSFRHLAAGAGQSPSVKPESIHFAGHHYVADLCDGGHAELTLDPRLQTSTDEVLRAFQIPYAGAVVVSIPDGRVLAMVGRSAADPRLGPADLALHPWAPSASVFKVVSATALVESGVSGRDAHLLPRRRLLGAARQPGQHPGDRRQLRHAGVRDRKVAERHRRQAGHRAPDRRGSRRAKGGASASARPSRSRSPSSRRTSTSPRTTGWRWRAPRPASGIRRFRRCTARCWRPPSPTGGDALADAGRARRRRGRPPRAAPRRLPPPRRRGRSGGRGGADDGADHPHRHGQGDIPQQAGPALSRRSRSPERPAR